MGFEFKSDQPNNKMVDSKTTLSVNEPTIVEEDLTQPIFAEGVEEKLALDFILENDLYQKFMLWCAIQDQLKTIKLDLATPIE
jgi:hypothetical protein